MPEVADMLSQLPPESVEAAAVKEKDWPLGLLTTTICDCVEDAPCPASARKLMALSDTASRGLSATTSTEGESCTTGGVAGSDVIATAKSAG
jgi:hypothetical protein